MDNIRRPQDVVIARQRPNGQRICIPKLEDETGIANIIVKPDLYESCRLTINRAKFLRVDGILQNSGWCDFH